MPNAWGKLAVSKASRQKLEDWDEILDVKEKGVDVTLGKLLDPKFPITILSFQNIHQQLRIRLPLWKIEIKSRIFLCISEIPTT